MIFYLIISAPPLISQVAKPNKPHKGPYGTEYQVGQHHIHTHLRITLTVNQEVDEQEGQARTESDNTNCNSVLTSIVIPVVIAPSMHIHFI